MEFKRPKKITERSIRKVDAVVTGMILGGIVASIYGLKKEHGAAGERLPDAIREVEKHGIGSILRMLVFGVPAEKPKKGFWSRLLSRFKDE